MENCLGPDGWQGRGEYVSPDGLVSLSVDYDDEDFHIDARPGYPASSMRNVLEQAKARGLEVMDEDECEPEILEDGTVRLYLAVAVQPAVLEPIALEIQEKRRTRAARRSTYALALAASVAVALLMPSPLHHKYPEAVTHVFDYEEADASDPIPMSSNEGELSGPDSQGHPASQASAPQPVGSTGWVGTTSRRSAYRGETAGTHPDYNFHRLHRGQVEPDRLGQAHGAGGSSPTPGPGKASPSPEPGGQAGQGVVGLLGGTVDGILGRQ